ncbi:hypothetical protein KKC59_00565, partial [bacterium]|nr:hypothetical protein [bacterium]
KGKYYFFIRSDKQVLVDSKISPPDLGYVTFYSEFNSTAGIVDLDANVYPRPPKTGIDDNAIIVNGSKISLNWYLLDTTNTKVDPTLAKYTSSASDNEHYIPKYKIYVYDNSKTPNDAEGYIKFEDNDGINNLGDGINDWKELEKDGGEAKRIFEVSSSEIKDVDANEIMDKIELDMLGADKISAGTYKVRVEAYNSQSKYGKVNESGAVVLANIFPLSPTPYSSLTIYSADHTKIGLTWMFNDEATLENKKPWVEYYTDNTEDTYIPKYKVYIFAKNNAPIVDNGFLDADDKKLTSESGKAKKIFEISGASIIEDAENSGAMDVVDISVVDYEGLAAGDYYIYVESFNTDNLAGKVSTPLSWNLTQAILALPPKPYIDVPMARQYEDEDNNETGYTACVPVKWQYSATETQYTNPLDSVYTNASSAKYIKSYEVLVYADKTLDSNNDGTFEFLPYYTANDNVDSAKIGFIREEDNSGAYDEETGTYKIDEGNDINDWEESFRTEGKALVKYTVESSELLTNDPNGYLTKFKDEIGILYKSAKDKGLLSTTTPTAVNPAKLYVFVRALNKNGNPGKLSDMGSVEIVDDLGLYYPGLAGMQPVVETPKVVQQGYLPVRWQLKKANGETVSPLSETMLQTVSKYEVLVYRKETVDTLGSPVDVDGELNDTGRWDEVYGKNIPTVDDAKAFAKFTVNSADLRMDDSNVLYKADLFDRNNVNISDETVLENGSYEFNFYVRPWVNSSNVAADWKKMSNKGLATLERNVPYSPYLLDPDALINDGDDDNIDDSGINDTDDNERQSITDTALADKLANGLFPLSWLMPQTADEDANLQSAKSSLKANDGHAVELLKEYDYYEVIISKDQVLPLTLGTDFHKPDTTGGKVYYQAYFSSNVDKIDTYYNDVRVRAMDLGASPIGENVTSEDYENVWNGTSFPFAEVARTNSNMPTTYFCWVRAVDGENSGYWSNAKIVTVSGVADEGLELPGDWR